MRYKDEKIKEEILIEAQSLFQQYGLKKTTMDEIAEACGKAKSTIYHYFEKKTEVFDAVVEMELQSLRKHVEERVNQHKRAFDKICTYLNEFHKEAVHKINLYRVINQEPKSKHHTYSNLKSIVRFEQNYITNILEEAHSLNQLRNIQKDKIPGISELFLVSFWGLAIYNRENDGSLNEQKLFEATRLIVPSIFN